MLSFFSLTLLKPSFIRGELVAIPSSCPVVDSSDIPHNYDIQDGIKTQSFVATGQVIARKVNDTYYEYTKSSSGDIFEHEIKQLSGNPLLIACVCVSCVLCATGSFFLFVSLIRYRRTLTK